MVRSEGYLKSRTDFENVPITTNAGGVPVLLRDVATVRRGPTFRRGLAELDGQGEVVGGIIVMRTGKNATATIAAVKARLAELQRRQDRQSVGRGQSGSVRVDPGGRRVMTKKKIK